MSSFAASAEPCMSAWRNTPSRISGNSISTVRGFHPPFLGLLGPIANRGDVAARFAVGKMQQARDGLDYWMVLIVFREMIRKRNVDVCGRPEYFDVLVQGEARVPDPGWRKIYQGVLQHMCPASVLGTPGTT